MGDRLRYRGFKGTVEFSADDRVLHRKVHGIRDSVSLEGESIDALEAKFHGALDDDLELCEKIGKRP